MNVTLGQYYPSDSIIHKLDPRTKIIGTMLYIAMVFLSNNIISYGICTLLFVYLAKVSHVPVLMAIRGLKGMVFIIIITALFNIFFIKTGNTIIKTPLINITDDGLFTTISLCLRLVLIVCTSSFLTFTTTPISLADGVERLLRKPCSLTKISSSEIGMIMSIALRFIPTLIEELDKIKKAQQARGADFENGGLIKRAKNMIPLLVPLFLSSFRRADELAMAMESRCYRPDMKRTKLRELKYTKNDYYAYGVILFLLAVVVVVSLVWSMK